MGSRKRENWRAVWDKLVFQLYESAFLWSSCSFRAFSGKRILLGKAELEDLGLKIVNLKK